MADFATEIGNTLPYLRRYARALTGSQELGDQIAGDTLEALLEDRAAIPAIGNVKVSLYACFHRTWDKAHAEKGGVTGETGLRAMAQKHMANLTPNSREALLLKTVEGFSLDTVAQIMGLTKEEVETLVDTARSEMAHSATGKVLIIEDEPIIAADIQSIVEALGHDVIGVARTHHDAVELGKEGNPELILADIQLADNSSGIDAVTELLQAMGQLPVIFITAFPERLLTGARPEPAFLISKPYSEETVQSAVSQAMFFASTDGLTV